MIQFKQYFVPVQIQEMTFCREGTRTMDARRAQDILRHIINDEDYGAAMLDKISVPARPAAFNFFFGLV